VQRRVLWEALVFRLHWMRHLTGPFLGDVELTNAERRHMLATLRNALCGRSDLATADD
jgi:hypothetical protein